jgi:hypothetical protein
VRGGGARRRQFWEAGRGGGGVCGEEQRWLSQGRDRVREERGRWSERRAGRQVREREATMAGEGGRRRVREREAAAVGEEEGGGGDR